MIGWERGPVVGRGCFGTVHLARCSPAATSGENSPAFMAVKSCPLSESSTLLREKSYLYQLAGCSEIVTCYGGAATTEPDGRRLYNLFLEYLPGGSLAELRQRRPLAAAELRRIVASLLRGLRQIHSAGIVHCDIKPQNLLVSGAGAVKIADFGLSKLAGGAEKHSRSNSLRGTPLYMAPESVTAGEYEAPADIWALGCVVAEMVSGEPPWRRSKATDVGSLLFFLSSGQWTPEIPEELPEEGRDFLRRCFVRSPGERWTAEMLLRHPFVETFFSSDEKPSSLPQTSPKSVFEFPFPPPPLKLRRWSPVPSSSPAPANTPGDIARGSSHWPSWDSLEDSLWVTVREMAGKGSEPEPAACDSELSSSPQPAAGSKRRHRSSEQEDPILSTKVDCWIQKELLPSTGSFSGFCEVPRQHHRDEKRPAPHPFSPLENG